MKLISWNVNGIRATLKKGFNDFLAAQNPDIICLQETKAHPEQVKNLDSSDYFCFWNSAEKKGYSGTAIFTKEEPIRVFKGIGIEDNEGRVITAEFADFNLVTVYTPNSKRDLSRLNYRQKWDQYFCAYLVGLKSKSKKPVIFCGDLNVAHKEIDLANPKSNKKNAGFTPQERAGFDRFVANGFVDTFRHFNVRPHHYTWWSYMHKARARNIGWRLDYFCVSEEVIDKIESSRILADVHGSDHCPVSLVLK
jgi:exodeoxyribonuclease-3